MTIKCEYKRCGGLGKRETSEKMRRYARTTVYINGQPLQVCESCVIWCIEMSNSTSVKFAATGVRMCRMSLKVPRIFSRVYSTDLGRKQTLPMWSPRRNPQSLPVTDRLILVSLSDLSSAVTGQLPRAPLDCVSS